MFGNSARIDSHTIPVYDPALCPRMNSEPTMYPANFKASAGRVSGGRQTPTNGCATSNLVKSRIPCSYPGHGGFLCAGVMGQKSNTFMARWMIWLAVGGYQALQEHGTRYGGQLGTWRGEAGGIPGCVRCLQLCRLFLPVILLAQRGTIYVGFFSACQKDFPVVVQLSSTQSGALNIQVPCVSGIDLPTGVFHNDFFPILIFWVGMAGKDFIDSQLGVAGVDLQSFL